MPFLSSGSYSNLYWSRNIGPAHVIALCSYAATKPGSLQYAWLQGDLAQAEPPVLLGLICTAPRLSHALSLCGLTKSIRALRITYRHISDPHLTPTLSIHPELTPLSPQLYLATPQT